MFIHLFKGITFQTRKIKVCFYHETYSRDHQSRQRVTLKWNLKCFNHGSNPNGTLWIRRANRGGSKRSSKDRTVGSSNDIHCCKEGGWCARREIQRKQQSRRYPWLGCNSSSTKNCSGCRKWEPYRICSTPEYHNSWRTTNQKRYISVKIPQLDLQKKSESPFWCEEGTTSPSESKDMKSYFFVPRALVSLRNVILHNNGSGQVWRHDLLAGKISRRRKAIFWTKQGHET